ncbi:MAG: hypothetical protein PHO86_05640 [Bacilli bacterium]|nr:hypothetical protein [Bacilli bacterium]
MIIQREKYLEKGKEILKSLINNGCEAYFTGELVRNKILGIDFNSIEICTSATPENVRSIFSGNRVEVVNDGLVKLTVGEFDYLVGTFKEEIRSESRKALQSHYSKSLIDDLQRRDFTINAMAMSHSGKVTDAFNGYEDLQKKRIKAIGKPRLRFNENPARILTAFRLVSELGFKIDKATYSAMRNNKMLANVPVGVLVEELKHIINGPNFRKALAYIVDSNAYRRIPILGVEFKRLNKKYHEENLETILGCAFVQNKGIDETFITMSKDVNTLKKVVDLALVTPKSQYDTLLLFNYGLEVCQQANYINVLLGNAKRKSRKIRKEYSLLPIKKVCDLAFKGEDILKLTNNLNGPYIQEVMDEIIYKILFNELPNDYDAIKIFAVGALKERGLLLGSSYQNRYSEKTSFERPKEANRPIVDDFYEEKNIPLVKPIEETSMESKFEEYERRLNEKDRKIAELESSRLEVELANEVKQLVSKNVDMLGNIAEGDEASRAEVKANLEKMYRDILIKSNPKYKKLKDRNNE